MAITSGISEKVEVIEETAFGSGTGTSKEFGHIEGITFKADPHSTVYYSADGTNLPNDIVDGVLEFSGDLKWKLTDGREFGAILGSLTDDGNGSYTLGVSNSSPSYSFKAILDDTQNVHIKGSKFSRFNLNISKDSIVDVSGDWLAQNIVELATEVTPQVPTEKPYQFTDAVITFENGTSIMMDSFSLSLDRQSTSYRGIESTGTNEKRLITAIVDKNLSITGSGTAIAKKEIFESILGGATLEDYRATADIVVTLENDASSLTLTIPALLSSFSKSTNAESDLILVDFDFIGKNISGSGTYTV